MENFENEIWKDIPNYEGIYQVSNLGRIKSLERIDARGRRLKEKILKPKLARGYYLIGLTKQATQKFYYVHRLVYEAFNDLIPENMQVNHLDERPINNALSNLNLMTCKENINYGTRNERSAKKLSKVVLQFDLNDNLVKEYASTHQAERETGFANQNIVKCCKGKRKTAYGFKWKYKN